MRDRIRQQKVEQAKKDLALHVEWAESIVDKQYRLYVWNDGKIQMLGAVNGLLFTAAAIVFKDGPSTGAAAILLAIAAIFLLTSLLQCLSAIKTFPYSGRSKEKSDEPNLRSLKGIAEYATWRDYREQFRSANAQVFINHTLRQIWGMSINNLASHNKMGKAVHLTIAGTAFLFAALVAHILPPVADMLPDQVRGYLPRIVMDRTWAPADTQKNVVESANTERICPCTNTFQARERH